MGELLRRRAIMKLASQSPTPALPDEYQQTEYTERPYIPAAQGSAAGFITTPLTLAANEDVEFKLGIMVTFNQSSNNYFIGNRSATNANTVGVGIHANSGSTQIGIHSGTDVLISPNDGASILNRYYDIKAVLTSAGASITDGTHNNSESFTPRAINITPIYVFGLKRYSANTVVNGTFGRVYYAKIWQNGVLKLNLIPCYRKADNAVGFYDTVSESFVYGNKLESGPEVN